MNEFGRKPRPEDWEEILPSGSEIAKAAKRRRPKSKKKPPGLHPVKTGEKSPTGETRTPAGKIIPPKTD